MTELFALDNFSFTYPNEPSPCLRGVTCAIQPGEFVLLTGCSGSGKTTLLRQLKPELAAHGARGGSLRYRGQSLAKLSRRESAGIGFVGQDPELQIVTDKVWHELAFGLENLGLPSQEIRRRVAEMSSFFDISSWFHADTAALSGGQKQILALAAVAVMQPRALLLDEPCSQLDPIATADFLSLLTKLNRELGVTVLLAEHRPDNLLPLVDRALLLEDGGLALDAPPRRFAATLIRSAHPLAAAMPAAACIAAAAETGPEAAPDHTPITVREGRLWLANYATRHSLPAKAAAAAPALPEKRLLLTMKDIDYHYKGSDRDVLCGLSLHVAEKDILAICGANGSGKSTLLKLMAGVYKPCGGKLSLAGGVQPRLLPQHPRMLFTTERCRDELTELTDRLPPDEAKRRLELAVDRCELSAAVLARHPYDISGGEQQRLALAKLLLTQPRLLLLDEPTKGFDAAYKTRFAALLAQLCRDGVTVVMVTHDIEFAAAYAQRAALLFDGAIISEGAAREFFTRNSFYTTAANRMARELLPDAVTAADVLAGLGCA